jgi:hypothetical protein
MYIYIYMYRYIYISCGFDAPEKCRLFTTYVYIHLYFILYLIIIYNFEYSYIISNIHIHRDTRTLLDSNIWQIRSTEGFILFPGSDHVETIVVFDKKGVTV